MEQKHTGRLIAASSDESADILYGSGFHAPDEFVYFETPETTGLVVSVLELSRARAEARPGLVLIEYSELLKKDTPDAPAPNLYERLSARYGVDRWIVPSRFPLGTAERIRAAGIAVEVCTGDFFPDRAVKRADEIEAIAQSMEATEDAMRQVRDFLKESKVNAQGVLEWHGRILTSEYLRREIESEFKRRGYTANRTILACGREASAPHCIGMGPIRAHEPLVADIFPRSDTTGYWGDMTRTFVKGRASEIVRRAYRAVSEASQAALSHLRAGVPGVLLHQIAAKTMEDAGFRTGRNPSGTPVGFIHGLGHGLGLEIHEQPRVSPANPNALPAGAVVSIEPGLYDPAWGGIRLEDLVCVTASGCRNFCSMEKDLEIS